MKIKQEQNNFFDHMEDVSIVNIAAWAITALLGIVTFFSQLGIKSVTDKLKKLESENQQNKTDIHELKTMIQLNTETDKYRMETLKKSFDYISEGIRDIKQAQTTQQHEIKTLDGRLTSFIIDTGKHIARLVND
jgi:hypothetical protein